MPFKEDLGQFLRVDDFAHACELRLAGGVVRAVACIFDEPSVDAGIGGRDQSGRSRVPGYTFDTTTPQVVGRAIDFAGVARGDILVIEGREFDIMASPQVDGTGMAILRLSPSPGKGAR